MRFMRVYLISLVFLAPGVVLGAAAPGGAREQSLGDLSTASVESVAAPFRNPAFLAGTPALHTAFSQAKLTFDTLNFQVSAAFPLHTGGLGLGVAWDAAAARDQAQQVIVRDGNGQVVVDPDTGEPLTELLGFFTRNDNKAVIALGAKAGRFSAGAGAKMLFTSFGGRQAFGFGADVGLAFPLSSFWTLGAVWRDIGDTRLNFQHAGEDEVVLSTAGVGSAFHAGFFGGFSIMLEPAWEKEVQGRGGRGFGMGVELSYRKSLFLRAGINRDRWSFGVGLAAGRKGRFAGIRVDYAYLARVGTGAFPSRLTLNVEW